MRDEDHHGTRALMPRSTHRLVTLAFWHALRSETALRTLAEANVSPRQALAFRALAPLGAALIKRGLRIDEAGVRRALERVRSQIAGMNEALERGPYLVGETFTAA